MSAREPNCLLSIIALRNQDDFGHQNVDQLHLAWFEIKVSEEEQDAGPERCEAVEAAR